MQTPEVRGFDISSRDLQGYHESWITTFLHRHYTKSNIVVDSPYGYTLIKRMIYQEHGDALNGREAYRVVSDRYGLAKGSIHWYGNRGGQ